MKRAKRMRFYPICLHLCWELLWIRFHQTCFDWHGPQFSLSSGCQLILILLECLIFNSEGPGEKTRGSRAQERVILAFLTRLLRFGLCHGTCSIHRWKLCSVALDDRIGLDNTGSHMLAFYKAFVPEERHHHLRHPVSSSMTSFWPSSRSTKNNNSAHLKDTWLKRSHERHNRPLSRL